MSDRQFLFMKITVLLLLQNGLLAAMAVYFSPGMSTAMMAALAAGVTVFSMAAAMMATRIACMEEMTAPLTPSLIHPANALAPLPAAGTRDLAIRAETEKPMASVARLVATQEHGHPTSAERLEAAETALRSLDAAARRLASGDLSARLDTPFASPFEGIRGDFNRAASSFDDSMAAITVAAGTLHGECAQARLRLHRERTEMTDEIPALSAAGNGIRDIAELLEKQTQTVDEIIAEIGEARTRLLTEREAAESAAQDMVVVDGKLGSATAQMRDIAFRANMIAVGTNLASTDPAADAGAMQGFAADMRKLAEEGADAARQASILERELAKAVTRAKAAIDRMVREEKQMETRLERAHDRLQAVSQASRMSADMSSEIGGIVADAVTASGKRRILDHALEKALERMGHELGEINRHCGRFIPVTTVHDGLSPPDGGSGRSRGYLRLVKS